VLFLLSGDFASHSSDSWVDFLPGYEYPSFQSTQFNLRLREVAQVAAKPILLNSQPTAIASRVLFGSAYEQKNSGMYRQIAF
jgi:hypothetical protein